MLIVLERIESLPLLPDLFGKVNAPPAVFREFGSSPPWLQEVAVSDENLQAFAESYKLDPGEMRAIALALEHPGCVLLIDERRGRQYAVYKQIRVVGTFGIVVLAKRRGILETVKPILDALMQAGFRASKAVYERALMEAGEQQIYYHRFLATSSSSLDTKAALAMSCRYGSAGEGLAGA